MKTLLLTLLLLLSAGAFGQNDFPDNAKNRWVLKEVNALKKDGLLLEWSKTNTKVQQSQRKKFASVTHVASYRIRYLLIMMEGKTPPTAEELQKAKSWKTHAIQLSKMVDVFAPELKQMKIDAKKVKSDLADTVKRLDKLTAS